MQSSVKHLVQHSSSTSSSVDVSKLPSHEGSVIEKTLGTKNASVATKDNMDVESVNASLDDINDPIDFTESANNIPESSTSINNDEMVHSGTGKHTLESDPSNYNQNNSTKRQQTATANKLFDHHKQVFEPEKSARAQQTANDIYSSASNTVASGRIQKFEEGKLTGVYIPYDPDQVEPPNVAKETVIPFATTSTITHHDVCVECNENITQNQSVFECSTCLVKYHTKCAPRREDVLKAFKCDECYHQHVPHNSEVPQFAKASSLPHDYTGQCFICTMSGHLWHECPKAKDNSFLSGRIDQISRNYAVSVRVVSYQVQMIRLLISNI